jgi:hypothetical protein
MGVQQTYGGIVRVFYPLLAAGAWDFFVTARPDDAVVQVPFWMSSALVAAMLFLSAGLGAYQYRTSTEHPVVPTPGPADAPAPAEVKGSP